MTNKVFGVILSAFMEGLGACCEWPPGSKSTEQLEVALDIAKQCLSKFKEPVNSIEDAEKKSCEAIRLLTKRYVHDHHVLHCSIYWDLFCDAILVSILSHVFLSIQENKTHQVKMN